MNINKQRVQNETIYPGLEDDATDSRHPKNTINVGFVDGHAERIDAEDIFVEFIDANDNYNHINHFPLRVHSHS